MKLQPIEGIYKVNPEFANMLPKRHQKYLFRIMDSRNGNVFVKPVKQNGEDTAFHTSAAMMRWIPMRWLELV